MKTWLYVTALLGFVMAVQIGFLPPLFGTLPVPNLVLLILTVYATGQRGYGGYNEDRILALYPVTALAAILFEFFSPGPTGLYLVVFLGVVAAARFISHRVIESGVHMQTMGLVTLLVGVIAPLIYMIVQGVYYFSHLIFSAVLTAILIIPLLLYRYVRT